MLRLSPPPTAMATDRRPHGIRRQASAIGRHTSAPVRDSSAIEIGGRHPSERVVGIVECAPCPLQNGPPGVGRIVNARNFG
jgi:hypothetical protein